MVADAGRLGSGGMCSSEQNSSYDPDMTPSIECQAPLKKESHAVQKSDKKLTHDACNDQKDRPVSSLVTHLVDENPPPHVFDQADLRRSYSTPRSKPANLSHPINYDPKKDKKTLGVNVTPAEDPIRNLFDSAQTEVLKQTQHAVSILVTNKKLPFVATVQALEELAQTLMTNSQLDAAIYALSELEKIYIQHQPLGALSCQMRILTLQGRATEALEKYRDIRFELDKLAQSKEVFNALFLRQAESWYPFIQQLVQQENEQAKIASFQPMLQAINIMRMRMYEHFARKQAAASDEKEKRHYQREQLLGSAFFDQIILELQSGKIKSLEEAFEYHKDYVIPLPNEFAPAVLKGANFKTMMDDCGIEWDSLRVLCAIAKEPDKLKREHLILDLIDGKQGDFLSGGLREVSLNLRVSYPAQTILFLLESLESSDSWQIQERAKKIKAQVNGTSSKLGIPFIRDEVYFELIKEGAKTTAILLAAMSAGAMVGAYVTLEIAAAEALATGSATIEISRKAKVAGYLVRLLTTTTLDLGLKNIFLGGSHFTAKNFAKSLATFALFDGVELFWSKTFGLAFEHAAKGVSSRLALMGIHTANEITKLAINEVPVFLALGHCENLLGALLGSLDFVQDKSLREEISEILLTIAQLRLGALASRPVAQGVSNLLLNKQIEKHFKVFEKRLESLRHKLQTWHQTGTIKDISPVELARLLGQISEIDAFLKARNQPMNGNAELQAIVMFRLALEDEIIKDPKKRKTVKHLLKLIDEFLKEESRHQLSSQAAERHYDTAYRLAFVQALAIAYTTKNNKILRDLLKERQKGGTHQTALLGFFNQYAQKLWMLGENACASTSILLLYYLKNPTHLATLMNQSVSAADPLAIVKKDFDKIARDINFTPGDGLSVEQINQMLKVTDSSDVFVESSDQEEMIKSLDAQLKSGQPSSAGVLIGVRKNSLDAADNVSSSFHTYVVIGKDARGNYIILNPHENQVYKREVISPHLLKESLVAIARPQSTLTPIVAGPSALRIEPNEKPRFKGDLSANKLPEPREYQLEAADNTIQAMEKGKTNGLIVLPTGTGKTFTFSYTAEKVIKKQLFLDKNGKPKKTLILVHSDELLGQAKKAVEARLGAGSVSLVSSKRGQTDFSGPVVIASIQSLIAEGRLNELDPEEFGLVIADEAHHSVSNSWRTALAKLGFLDPSGQESRSPKGRFLLGVTATPDRLDGVALSGIFNEGGEHGLLFSKPYEWFVDHHPPYLAKPLGFHVSVNLSSVPIEKGEEGRDFNQAKLGRTMMTPLAIKTVVEGHKQHIGFKKKAIVFATNREHAELLAEEYNRAHPDKPIAKVVMGDLPDREDIIEAHKRGDFQILISVTLLTEGYDDPAIEAVVVARPTASRALYAQMIGRGSRIFGDKKSFAVLDVTSNIFAHKISLDLEEFFGVQRDEDDKDPFDPLKKKKERQEQVQSQPTIQPAGTDSSSSPIPEVGDIAPNLVRTDVELIASKNITSLSSFLHALLRDKFLHDIDKMAWLFPKIREYLNPHSSYFVHVTEAQVREDFKHCQAYLGISLDELVGMWIQETVPRKQQDIKEMMEHAYAESRASLNVNNFWRNFARIWIEKKHLRLKASDIKSLIEFEINFWREQEEFNKTEAMQKIESVLSLVDSELGVAKDRFKKLLEIIELEEITIESWLPEIARNKYLLFSNYHGPLGGYFESHGLSYSVIRKKIQEQRAKLALNLQQDPNYFVKLIKKLVDHSQDYKENERISKDTLRKNFVSATGIFEENAFSRFYHQALTSPLVPEADKIGLIETIEKGVLKLPDDLYESLTKNFDLVVPMPENFTVDVYKKKLVDLGYPLSAVKVIAQNLAVKAKEKYEQKLRGLIEQSTTSTKGNTGLQSTMNPQTTPIYFRFPKINPPSFDVAQRLQHATWTDADLNLCLPLLNWTADQMNLSKDILNAWVTEKANRQNYGFLIILNLSQRVVDILDYINRVHPSDFQNREALLKRAAMLTGLSTEQFEAWHALARALHGNVVKTLPQAQSNSPVAQYNTRLNAIRNGDFTYKGKTITKRQELFKTMPDFDEIWKQASLFWDFTKKTIKPATDPIWNVMPEQADRIAMGTIGRILFQEVASGGAGFKAFNPNSAAASKKTPTGTR